MRTRRPRAAPVPRSAFTGFRFPSAVIVLAVRWHLRLGLSYRDVEELLTERGVQVDHVTIDRWVQRFTPLLAEAARPCRHAVGDRWFVTGSRPTRPPEGAAGADARAQQDRSASVVIAGHGLVQNVRRGHDELAVEEPAPRRLAVAFAELAMAV
jgi:hypothetical protein